jgi:hypothetical protein
VAILLLRDLPGDQQLTLLQLYVGLVLADPGQLDMDLVGVIGLGYVSRRRQGAPPGPMPTSPKARFSSWPMRLWMSSNSQLAS